MKNPFSTWKKHLSGTAESVKVYKWVWTKLLSEKSKRFAKWMILFVVLGQGIGMASPWILGLYVDALADPNPMHWYHLGALTTCFALSRIFHFIKGLFREVAWGENVRMLDWRSNQLFMEKSLGQHLSQADRLAASNMEKGRNRLFDVQQVLLFEMVEVLYMLFISYVFVWMMSPVAGMIMSAGFISFILWSLVINQKIAQIGIPIDKDFRAVNRHRVERMDRVERVKAFGKEDEEVAFQNQWLEKTIMADRKLWFWVIKHMNARSIINISCLIGVVGYAGMNVRAGIWEMGILVPLYLWCKGIVDNLWRVDYMERRLNEAMPSVRAMMQALTIAPDVVDKDDAITLQANQPIGVSFSGISHKYPQSNGTPAQPVLKNITFDVKPGEVVALLGQSGVGKTTIMRLLQRAMDPQEGSVSVCGSDLRNIKLSSWLSKTGYIAQQPAVLDGTVKYNLLYGLEPEQRALVTDEQLWALMEQFKIDFGERLTEGLQTKVGKNGLKLSGGEAQRLMIGAAAIKNPDFMIIDEATSSLDSTTEKQVQHGLAELLNGGMGALIIAHRLSTVRDICDKFVVLRPVAELVNGDPQVEAIATSFDELFKTSPTFRRLAGDQGITV